jgi:PAS domain S-box-containing protein
VARALQGEASYFENLPICLERAGSPERTWWTFSYSPIHDETGAVGGVLCTVHETTGQVLTERRLRFLVDLGSRLRSLADSREVMAAAVEMLGSCLAVGRAGYGETDAAGAFFTVEGDWTDRAMPSLVGRHRLDDFGVPLIRELRAGRTIRVDDALADPRATGEGVAAAFTAIGMRAGLCVPLIKAGRLAAALYVHQAEPRRWRGDELALVQEVAERTWEAVGRARAEATLRESEARFRLFAAHTSNVLWIVEVRTGRIVYLSPAFERVWGEPLSDMLGEDWHRWADTVHPDDRNAAADAMERALGGEIVAQEYRIVRADGAVRWIRDTFFPITDGDQGARVRWAAGIAQDITVNESSLVYLVDGSEGARRELALLLQGAGYEVKGFTSALAFLEMAQALVPGCVLLDGTGLETGGLAVLRDLKARRTELPVIVLSADRGVIGTAVQAMKAGASDFVETPCAPETLLTTVASALREIRAVTERDRTATLARLRIAEMSVREREVLNGLLEGRTNKTIARTLGISPRTVEVHRAHLMERLGVRSLPEAVLAAAAAGLQPPKTVEDEADQGL